MSILRKESKNRFELSLKGQSQFCLDLFSLKNISDIFVTFLLGVFVTSDNKIQKKCGSYFLFCLFQILKQNKIEFVKGDFFVD